MPFNINRVCLIGNLTKDPELRHTAGGNAVCGLRIAVNGRERDGSGEWVDRADYFDIRVWGNLGEACATNLTRGAPIAVDGHLRFEEWKDKDTGGSRSRVLVVATNVQFIKRGQGGGSRMGAETIPDGEFTVPEADFSSAVGSGAQLSNGPDDDIPF